MFHCLMNLFNELLNQISKDNKGQLFKLKKQSGIILNHPFCTATQWLRFSIPYYFTLNTGVLTLNHKKASSKTQPTVVKQ